MVDTNGGLKTAIAIAADKAELGDKFRIVEMTEAPTGFGAFFSGFMAKVKADIVAGELGPGPASGARFVRRWDSRA